MSDSIGLITNTQLGVFQRAVIAGVERIVTAKGYTLLVDSLQENPAQQPTLNVADLAGLIVIANAMPDTFLHQVYQSGKPLTLVSHRVPDDVIPAVIPDNIEGMVRMVDFLVEVCGRRRIVFIEGDLQQNDGRQRSRVFREQLLRHDVTMPPEYYLRGDFDPPVARKSLETFLQMQPAGVFDAVATADFLMAIETLGVLRAAGIRVPEDICVVGFGDGVEAEEAGLTTIGVNVNELGQRAARQLIGQINGLKMRGVTIISTDIIRRETG